MAVSIKQVAQRAGVSLGTVSNVLNRPDIVAEETRQRVQHVIAELGFVRNESARALRAGRSRTVGFVVLDAANPFFTDVAAGVEAVADEHGLTIALCNSGEMAEREQRHLAHLEEQRVRGVLLTPVDDRGGENVARLVERGIPVVLLDRTANPDRRCSVSVDDVLGGRLVGEHLAAQGHSRIAFVGSPSRMTQVAHRLQGLRQALASAGVATDLSVVSTDVLSLGEGARAGRAIAELPRARRPTAVACANDLLALGVLQALTMGGLKVPSDVAIVGYDDIVYAEAAAVPLSSVRQPRAMLGRTAFGLLLEEMTPLAPHQHQRVVFEPELVVRASSAHRRRRTTAEQQRLS